jgi:hypothetical protein
MYFVKVWYLQIKKQYITERLNQVHLHPRSPETDMSWPGIEPGPTRWEGEHSSKELFEQLINSYLFGTFTHEPATI